HPSSEKLIHGGIAAGIRATMACRQAAPSGTPTAAPAAAITKFSVNSCATTRLREAPIAIRIAISRDREDPRTVINAAILTQAISSTRPTAPDNTRLTVLKSPR